MKDKFRPGISINGHYIHRSHLSTTSEEKYKPGFFKKLMIQLLRKVRV